VTGASDRRHHAAFSDPGGSGRRGLPSPSRVDAQPVVRAATLVFLRRELFGQPEADAVLAREALLPLLSGGVIDDVEVLHR